MEHPTAHLNVILDRLRQDMTLMVHRQIGLIEQVNLMNRKLDWIISSRRTKARRPSKKFTAGIFDPLSAPIVKWAIGTLIIIYLAKGGDPGTAIGWLIGIK